MSLRKARNIYMGSSAPAPVPIGALYADEYNPSPGTYTDVSPGASLVTPGNMALSGGNGFFTRVTVLEDVVWNGNSWYIEYEAECTNTNNGQLSAIIGLLSINSSQHQSCAFGPYYFDGNNNALLYIFNEDNLNSGQSARKFTQNVAIAAGQRFRVRGEFTESSLVITVTNLVTLASTSDTLNYSYTLAGASNTWEIKPNTAKVFFLSPASTVNIKRLEFGTPYLDRPYLQVIADSIGSGYYQQSEAQRWINQWAALTGKTYMNLSGPSDKLSQELNNSTALTLVENVHPNKIFIPGGTNDKANGVSNAVIYGALCTIIDKKLSDGAVINQIYVGELLPRDGVDTASVNAHYHANLPTDYPGITIVPLNLPFQKPGDPTLINPALSADGVHPTTAAGALLYANTLITAGIS